MRRSPTEQHLRTEDGAWFRDGRRGWVSDWSHGAKINWYDNPDARGFTAANKRAQELRQAQVHRQAERTACELLRACTPAEHTDLRRKQLPDAPRLVDEERDLVVPTRTVDSHQLIGVQVIRWLMDERVWQKKMLYGSRSKDASLRSDPALARNIAGRDYATGLTRGTGAARDAAAAVTRNARHKVADMIYVSRRQRRDRQHHHDEDRTCQLLVKRRHAIPPRH